MLDTQDKNNVTIVGYKQATLTQEYAWWIGQECKHINIVEPDNLIPSDDTAYIISITKDSHERINVIERLKNKLFAKFIHASAVFHGTSKVGNGTFIGPNVSLFFNCNIGDHCIIGPYSMISHATTIGTSNIVHPGTIIAGSCTVGDYCLFGMRSTVIDKITIANGVQIVAGALVTKDITEPGKYVGSPARKVK